MPNKAVHQLPLATTRQDTDLFYVVRSGVDHSLPASALPPALESYTTYIATADVLQLNSVPVLVVPAPAAGKILVPRFAIVRFQGGTLDYATNTDLRFYCTAIGQAILRGSIADRSTPNFAAPVSGQFAGGSGISLAVDTGDPTTGDSDLVVQTFYSLQDA